MNFKTEEEKLEAIKNFDERVADISKLEEIENATVGEEAGEEVEETENTEPVHEEDQQDSEDTEKSIDENTETGDTEKPKTDLEKTIEEQQKYIKDLLAQTGKIKSLEEKLSQIEQAKQPPQTVTKKEFKESKLDVLMARKKALLEKYKDPDDRFDEEYSREMEEINNGLFDELASVNYNLQLVKEDAEQAKSKATQYVEQKDTENQQQKILAEQERQIKEIESFAQKDERFKMSKSFKDVQSDFQNYQKDVAKIYWGREPESQTEIEEAMVQLNRKAPSFIQKLKLSGVSPTLSSDFIKFNSLVEMWDRWQGYYPDPITGRYNTDDNGRIIPHMVYEPTLNKYVPAKYPSFESVVNDQDAQKGYWVNKIIEAKIEGGKRALNAIQKRDNGTVEMDGSEVGGHETSVQQALDQIYEIDEVAAINEARKGNTAKFDKYNELSKILKWAPLEV